MDKIKKFFNTLMTSPLDKMSTQEKSMYLQGVLQGLSLFISVNELVHIRKNYTVREMFSWRGNIRYYKTRWFPMLVNYGATFWMVKLQNDRDKAVEEPPSQLRTAAEALHQEDEPELTNAALGWPSQPAQPAWMRTMLPPKTSEGTEHRGW